MPSVSTPALEPVPNPGPVMAEVSLWGSPADPEMYSRLERGGYLTSPPRLTQNAFERWPEIIFTPEMIRIRQVSVSCTLITAIKRRNPLCLLNPYFIWISW